MNYYTL